MLLGAIIGSTDAAAVFSLLRNAGIHINQRLKSVLEIESASNDPMAIFLTVGLLEVLVNSMPLGWGLLQMFLMQMGIGALVGLGVGWSILRLLSRIKLVATGISGACCGRRIARLWVSANLGGSGFLAIFVAGVMIGNQKFVFQRSTFLFMDGLAWQPDHHVRSPRPARRSGFAARCVGRGVGDCTGPGVAGQAAGRRTNACAFGFNLRRRHSFPG